MRSFYEHGRTLAPGEKHDIHSSNEIWTRLEKFLKGIKNPLPVATTGEGFYASFL
ncbi:hypothetical protein ABEV55_17075 [Aneurinibacillus thermoaerophilus]|uniref:hypothetical protein n=1 Tax=Aneurinibacillus thermoaerophilus TaxID=143495 RepID=UPI003D246AE8